MVIIYCQLIFHACEFRRDWNRMQNVHPGVRVVFEIGYPGEIGLRCGVIFAAIDHIKFLLLLSSWIKGVLQWIGNAILISRLQIIELPF